MLARFPSYSGSRGETKYQDVGRNSALHEQSRNVKDTEDLRTSTLSLIRLLLRMYPLGQRRLSLYI